MAKKEKYNCDHCRKADCEKCVRDGGMTFCCRHCCDDYKKKKAESKIHVAAESICRFC